MTVTDVAEARAAQAAGADVLVLQGIEAGGHRGSWLDADEPEGLSMLALLRLVSRDVDLPLVAAGGLIDGPSIAGALVAGATAVQLGSAFPLCDEVGTHPVHRERLGGDTPTALTRAFTGRTARALATGSWTSTPKARPRHTRRCISRRHQSGRRPGRSVMATGSTSGPGRPTDSRPAARPQSWWSLWVLRPVRLWTWQRTAEARPVRPLCRLLTEVGAVAFDVGRHWDIGSGRVNASCSTRPRGPARHFRRVLG